MINKKNYEEAISSTAGNILLTIKENVLPSESDPQQRLARSSAASTRAFYACADVVACQPPIPYLFFCFY